MFSYIKSRICIIKDSPGVMRSSPLQKLSKKTYCMYLTDSAEKKAGVSAVVSSQSGSSSLLNFKSMTQISNVWNETLLNLSSDKIKLMLLTFREGYSWNFQGEAFQVESEHVSIVVCNLIYQQYMFNVGNVTTTSFCSALQQKGKFISEELLDGTRKYKITKLLTNTNDQNTKILTEKCWSKLSINDLTQTPGIIKVEKVEGSGQYFVASPNVVAYEDTIVLQKCRDIYSQYLERNSGTLLNHIKNTNFHNLQLTFYGDEGLIKRLHPQLSPNLIRNTHLKNSLTKAEIKLEKERENREVTSLFQKFLKNKDINDI